MGSRQGCGEREQKQGRTSRNVRKRSWEDVQADDRVVHRPLAQRDKVRDDDGRHGLDAAAARALDGCSPSDVQSSHARFDHVNELRVSRVGADDSASGSECDRDLRLGCARAVSRVAPARVDGAREGGKGRSLSDVRGQRHGNVVIVSSFPSARVGRRRVLRAAMSQDMFCAEPQRALPSAKRPRHVSMAGRRPNIFPAERV